MPTDWIYLGERSTADHLDALVADIIFGKPYSTMLGNDSCGHERCDCPYLERWERHRELPHYSTNQKDAALLSKEMERRGNPIKTRDLAERCREALRAVGFNRI